MASSNFTYNGRSNQIGTGNGSNGKTKMNVLLDVGYTNFQDCYNNVIVATRDKQQIG
jgi:hypothetical protein